MTTYTLVTGEVVDRDSTEAHDERFAKHILSKPKDQRGEWIEEYERQQGKEGADKLRATLIALHNARRNPHPSKAPESAGEIV